MDDKSSEGESKQKLTRSAARHVRRKRLSSARRAAERDSSPLTNVQANDLENSESRRIVDSLSKSKARRLRRKKKSDGGKSLEKNSNDKSEVADSPSRVKKTSIDESIDLSTEPTTLTDFSNARKEFFETTTTTTTIPSEHELFENEKNRKISENTKLLDESRGCTRHDYESGIITIDSRRDEITNFITNDDNNSRIIDESKIITGSSLIIRENEISTNSEESRRESKDHVEESLLRMEMSSVCATSDKVVGKMYSREKTREEIKAEREAKKAAKAASKNKIKTTKPELDENATLSKSSRCDVVDGAIIPMMRNIAFVSTLNLQPEVIDPLFCPKSQTEVKSKSELRAERRVKQEAQRAAKQQQQQQQQQPQSLEKPKVVNLMKEIANSTRTAEKLEKFEKTDETKTKIVKRATNAHEVNLFKHLYHDREQRMLNVPVVNSKIHPSIVRLGVQYAEKVIVGSNARCVALLAAVKQLVRDFEKPPHSDFTRSLEACLQESSSYLNRCRPIAVSMHNALRHLKWQMSQLEATTSDQEAKTRLENAIDTYIQEQIQLADKAISITIQTKISNGDVILTYGYSSLICKILCDAHDAGRQFRVVVVDGRPWLEGREQLRRLAKHGLECSYVLINALSFIMPEVGKVFLGAHAILANGAVMSRVGTAQVALMAKSFNVPVLVACETHKSCERVQTDSIVYNEIADADELAKSPMGSTKKTSLMNWRGKKSLNLLNITYDVTPADLVTAVVTELAILPCTSVPVILRIKPSEI